MPSSKNDTTKGSGSNKVGTAPLIAVIGATGAQGIPVIKHLVRDGAFRVRALTRDASHPRARGLLALGPKGHVELMEGSAMNEDTVRRLFDGVDGAFVNLDGFAMGEKREVFWGIRIFELALTLGVRHFVWGNLDYVSRKNDFDLAVRTGHYDGKGRVAQYMSSFPSPWASQDGQRTTTWSVLTSGPYLDMLSEFLSPLLMPDGTRVFAAPMGDQGRMPLIDLDDLGFYARYMFDHPREFEGRDLEVSSEHVSWRQLAETFTKVTGLPARYIEVPEEDYFAPFDQTVPAGYQDKTAAQVGEDPPMSWYHNFRGWYRVFRKDCIKRDYAELDRIHPTRVDLEAWMRRTNYDGTRKGVLKNLQDVKTRPVTMGALVSTLLSGAVKYLRFGLGEVAIDTMHSGTMKWLTKHHPELFVAKTATGTGK